MPRETLVNPKTNNKLIQNISFEFYAPSAKAVKLAGTFNQWDPSKTILKKGPNGTWQTSIPLKSGRYEYRYQVDGNWENDQRPVKCVPNAFGTWNCVVEVS